LFLICFDYHLSRSGSDPQVVYEGCDAVAIRCIRTLTGITDESGNVVGANLTLSGHGTHLGSFTGTGKIQFLPDANDPNISHPAGEVTYVAANGDRLPAVIENGSMDLTTGIATGDMVFQSGTERFAGVSGRAAIVVEQNFITGAYTFTMVGNINY
jgi:hypothetical protein